MSFDHRQSDVFVDTGLLRDHVSKLCEQKKTATKLYNNVLAMRNCGDPSEYGKYYPILRDIDQLIDYLYTMYKVLNNAEDDAVQLSRVIGNLIEDGADNVRHTDSNAFML